MHDVRPSTDQKNEMETPKVGHLRMFNHKMHSGKRGDNSDEMFRHFLDYIFQINNDEDTEAGRINKRGRERNKDLSNQYESKPKRKFRPYSMRFFGDRVNTYEPREQKIDNSITNLQTSIDRVKTYEPREQKIDNSLTNLLTLIDRGRGNRIFDKYFDYVPFWA